MTRFFLYVFVALLFQNKLFAQTNDHSFILKPLVYSVDSGYFKLTIKNISDNNLLFNSLRDPKLGELEFEDYQLQNDTLIINLSVKESSDNKIAIQPHEYRKQKFKINEEHSMHLNKFKLIYNQTMTVVDVHYVKYTIETYH